MLIKTSSLARLLKQKDMTSDDILTLFWERDGHIFSLLPRECFVECRWEDLPTTSYAVMSYQWKSLWHTLVDFILHSDGRVLEDFMWIDAFCLNQMLTDKIKTIRRSDEIYSNAKAYHLMEIGALSRGWVLFELSSVPEALIPPKIHLSTQDHGLIEMAKLSLSRDGFNGCRFKEESDREIVQGKIVDRYGSIDEFNLRIIAIVNRIFV